MKNKKLIIIISSIVLVLIVVAVIIILLVNKNKENNVESELGTTFLQLADNSYKYYYYMFGDINTSDGYVEINGNTYYAVDDENVISIAEFDDLLLNTFVAEAQVRLYDVEEKNEYIEINDNMYVKKMTNPCQQIKELDFGNLKFDGDDEKKLAMYDFTSTYIYREDGEWKLEYNIYQCESETEEVEE